MSHHNSDPTCPLCAEKIAEAHPEMRAWFLDVKSRYPNAHVSWSFRCEEDQNQLVLDKKSRLSWPHSAHNQMEDGKPCSMALDLFQIDEDGVGRWSPLWFAKLNAENENNKLPIFWGGNWKTLGDNDHFELRRDTAGPDAA